MNMQPDGDVIQFADEMFDQRKQEIYKLEKSLRISMDKCERMLHDLSKLSKDVDPGVFVVENVRMEEKMLDLLRSLNEPCPICNLGRKHEHNAIIGYVTYLVMRAGHIKQELDEWNLDRLVPGESRPTLKEVT